MSVGSAFGRRSLDIADNYKKELYRVCDTALFTVGDRLTGYLLLAVQVAGFAWNFSVV